MTRVLEGKVAVITGAAGAIGTATSRLMAERGATIFAVDIPGADWSRLKAALPDGAKLATAEADVTDEASVKAYVDQAKAEFGRIDSGQSADAKAAHDATAGAVPAKRYGTPKEVAGLVAFLASDDAAYCNGSFYTVDGALSAT